MAKKEHYYTRFENNGIYHVYNRTVDRKSMFTSYDNYAYFLRQFNKYLSDFVKVYAYILLGNHFHLMIKINDFKDLNSKSFKQKTTHDIISHQFRKFFQSYAMAFNKQQNRVGTLFQTPFKRARIEDENYLRKLTCYIHVNAQKHGIVKNFDDWKWSSYHTIISSKRTNLERESLIVYFNDLNNFIDAHKEYAKKMNM